MKTRGEIIWKEEDWGTKEEEERKGWEEKRKEEECRGNGVRREHSRGKRKG